MIDLRKIKVRTLKLKPEEFLKKMGIDDTNIFKVDCYTTGRASDHGRITIDLHEVSC